MTTTRSASAARLTPRMAATAVRGLTDLSAASWTGWADVMRRARRGEPRGPQALTPPAPLSRRPAGRGGSQRRSCSEPPSSAACRGRGGLGGEGSVELEVLEDAVDPVAVAVAPQPQDHLVAEEPVGAHVRREDRHADDDVVVAELLG